MTYFQTMYFIKHLQMAVASFQGFENDVLFGKDKTGII